MQLNTVKNIFSLLAVVAIMAGLYIFATPTSREFASISGFEKFRYTLSDALKEARNTAISTKKDVMICSRDIKTNKCGTTTDWIYGFIVYEGKKTSIKDIPHSKLVKVYPLDIQNRIITEHDILDMKPTGDLTKDYHFIIRPNHDPHLLPNELTVYKNLSLKDKLISKKA